MRKNNDDSSHNSDASQTSLSCCINLKKPILKADKSHNSRRPNADGIRDKSPGVIAPSSSQVQFLPKPSSHGSKGQFKGLQLKEARIYSTPEFLVSDCWGPNKAEISMKFPGFYKEGSIEEDDLDVPIKKRRLDVTGENEKSLSYTREFHALTEIQKSRILTAVEDTIRRLASDDYYKESFKNYRDGSVQRSEQGNSEPAVCRKFLLPWVIMKVTEMVVCHIIQLIFLSDGSYFKRKDEFLPIVVTYYVTLFVIVVSLVVHICCFSYGGIQNPCYFMGVTSSSILTLTTTMGMLIMLTTMNYYKSYRQMLVLGFISAFVILLFAELCLFYVEVKSIWNKVDQIEQDYVT